MQVKLLVSVILQGVLCIPGGCVTVHNCKLTCDKLLGDLD